MGKRPIKRNVAAARRWRGVVRKGVGTWGGEVITRKIGDPVEDPPMPEYDRNPAAGHGYSSTRPKKQ